MKNLFVLLAVVLLSPSLAAAELETSYLNRDTDRAFIVDSGELAEFDSLLSLRRGDDERGRRSRRDSKLKYEGTGTAHLLANYYAKEFCSCIFVVGQEKKVCKRDVKHVSAVMGVDIDRGRKEIRTSSLLASGIARYVDERNGCMLIQD